MSKFHASVRDLLEDVYNFLAFGLKDEGLSSSSLSQKDKLVTQLSCFQQEYPELQINFGPRHVVIGSKGDKSEIPHRISSTSPVSYMDMNGGNPFKTPPTQTNTPSEDSAYDYFRTKDKLENPSLAESEDYLSDDAKNLPYVSAAELASCDKAGYLDKKKRESIKGWLNPYQRRWCAIKDGVLYYYEKFTDRKQRGSILLAGYEARPLSDDSSDAKKYNNCFELVCPGKRTYQFSAASEKDMQQWISAVEKNCYVTYSGRSISQYHSAMSTSSYSASKESDNACEMEDIYETVLEEEVNVKPINDKSEEEVLDNEEEYSDTILEQTPVFNYSDWYVCLWDCNGDNDTELSFVRGDLIRIVSKEYDSYAWWVGEMEGKIGFVPKSYLMEAYETY